mmetsp:Transcript_66093/g.138047  ORF Transcript_66093/g.138047 Transcript_66093/m.138047 type:complete len:273 (+) Transcript_66093:131-949(+)|eukprot:CAMPEP_0206419312 /NCGR_PEP_ID=MMETSP0324_2-20121206/18_1 /ASSEMBLY_ACC=CAM_ASM_000836 /TAXON_ID=2866 /ORGANISM="Crypthecodinium cohnii, Strain Seligo" /LENGTH=272 /DNA_ID=CAMNT_0053882673 /DNA_START=59 /DNA_END=877 /DNA_ORIENTATION=-
MTEISFPLPSLLKKVSDFFMPKAPPPSKVVTILGWDDTLLCNRLIGQADAESQDLMKEIEVEACKVVTQALRSGPVYIVTNSAASWVQESAVKYMPKFKHLLKKVKVISARDEYALDFPSQASRWKMKAFMDLATSTELAEAEDLFVVGHSVEQINAGHALASLFVQLRVKAVKFRTDPAPLDVLGQLRALVENFEQIVEDKGQQYCLEAQGENDPEDPKDSPDLPAVAEQVDDTDGDIDSDTDSGSSRPTKGNSNLTSNTNAGEETTKLSL